MSEWQTMDTAPTEDGTEFLIVVGGYVYIAQVMWLAAEEGASYLNHEWVPFKDATDWMPLPALPKVKP